MRNKIKFFLLVFFLTTFGFLLSKTYQIIKENENTQRGIERLNDFNLRTLDGSSFTKKDLQKNKLKVLVHFNSECDICKTEALNFKDNINLLQEHQIIYISAETSSKIKKFANDIGLISFDNVTFLQDKNKVFYNWTKTDEVPYILVYNIRDSLIFDHKGLMNFSELLKTLGNGS